MQVVLRKCKLQFLSAVSSDLDDMVYFPLQSIANNIKEKNRFLLLLSLNVIGYFLQIRVHLINQFLSLIRQPQWLQIYCDCFTKQTKTLILVQGMLTEINKREAAMLLALTVIQVFSLTYDWLKMDSPDVL